MHTYDQFDKDPTGESRKNTHTFGQTGIHDLTHLTGPFWIDGIGL